MKSRRGYVGAVAAAGYRLVAGKISGVAEVPVTFFPKKTTGLQQAFRLREGDWQLGLTVEALGQSVQADVFHLYSLKAGAAYGSVLINYFVVGAPATEWRISVPDGIGNIDVTGQNVGRDWRREGNTVIVPLSRPVLGTGTVLLTFEQPMSARGGDLSPGEVRPLDVQAERGYVQVVSPLQVKFTKPDSEGAVAWRSIPASCPPSSVCSAARRRLAAWQYTARDFKIGMKIEWFEPGETVEQAVDFLKLSSQVSRDGQWVTDARFFVKSRGRSSLRMSPAGRRGAVGGEGQWRGGECPRRWRRNPGAAALADGSESGGGSLLCAMGRALKMRARLQLVAPKLDCAGGDRRMDGDGRRRPPTRPTRRHGGTGAYQASRRAAGNGLRDIRERWGCCYC